MNSERDPTHKQIPFGCETLPSPSGSNGVPAPRRSTGSGRWFSEKRGRIDVVGRTVSQYRIEEKLGGGAMGVVYRAFDEKLQRDVALKFLPKRFAEDDAAKERFIHEAQAASQLDHPNVAAVHEIGETDEGHLFIVMPYYEGETLKQKIARGPVAFEDAIDWALQISRGLQAAHSAGIVHRDLKPANVMITTKGRAKIVDYGLAKVAGVELTGEGATLGTAAYMSPEQARGEKVDGRSDLWSLGVLLYEMLSGERPFSGEYAEAVTYAILHEPVEPLQNLRPDVPEPLARLVENLLQKDPSERPGSAGGVASRLERMLRGTGGDRGHRMFADVMSHLRRRLRSSAGRAAALVFLVIAAGALGYWGLFRDAGSETSQAPAAGAWMPRLGSESIAVMPFSYRAATDSSDYFSQGMTDELLILLSQIEDLNVISRTSVARYQNSNLTIPEIAHELGVAYVLEGSVQQVGGQVRLQAQLIDARSDRHVWADGMTRPFRDVLKLQVELARRIASELTVEILPATERRLAAAPEIDSAAYALYLQARKLRLEETAESLGRAYWIVKRSIAIDSTYAPAWSVLSFCAWYGSLLGSRLLEGVDGDSVARAAAKKALEIDSTSAEAHIQMGVVRQFLDFDFPAAGPFLKRAVELNPGLANAHREYGLYFRRMRQYAAAEHYLKEAARLNPASPLVIRQLGDNDVAVGKYTRAAQHYRQALALRGDSTQTLLRNLGFAYVGVDSLETALDVFRAAIAAEDELAWLVYSGWAYGRTGHSDSARAALQRLRAHFDDPLAEAIILAGLGDTDPLLDLFATADGVIWGPNSIVLFPIFRPIRYEPRFERYMAQFGLDTETVRRTMNKLGEPFSPPPGQHGSRKG